MRAVRGPGASLLVRRPARWSLGALVLVLGACPTDPVASDGQFGRPMALASGLDDVSPLPRLAFINESCPGSAGGCSAISDGACEMMLIDSLATMTAVHEPSLGGAELVADDCLEVRPAGGVLTSPDNDPEDRLGESLDAAVARFRFRNLPVVRTPDGGEDWTFTAGNQDQTVEPGGVLGGNLLRNFAVELRDPVRGQAEVSFFGEFPGSEQDLANQGRAFLPLQFPGSLLGRELADRCEVGDGRCELDGFDISTSSAEIPLEASRMVLDACVALPPCGLTYDPSEDDPFGVGTCEMKRGPTSDLECVSGPESDLGGLPASLVVATGVVGMVLFSDSATRMFGDLDAIEPCPQSISPTTVLDDVDAMVCRVFDADGADDGVLHFSGWPSAGVDTPLPRLRVRSVALVAGAARSRSAGPCTRAHERRNALQTQCNRYRRDTRDDQGDVDIRNATPPYSAHRDNDDGDAHEEDDSNSSIAVLGESQFASDSEGPRPARWIVTTILPASHSLARAVRRDVVPDALEPDGLLGTALLRGTDTVLDYTDINPAVRVRCLEPHLGRCHVLPDCATDRSDSCCHGLPRTLLNEYIRTLNDDACCGALSARDLDQMRVAGHCLSASDP